MGGEGRLILKKERRKSEYGEPIETSEERIQDIWLNNRDNRRGSAPPQRGRKAERKKGKEEESEK